MQYEFYQSTQRKCLLFLSFSISQFIFYSKFNFSKSWVEWHCCSILEFDSSSFLSFAVGEKTTMLTNFILQLKKQTQLTMSESDWFWWKNKLRFARVWFELNCLERAYSFLVAASIRFCVFCVFTILIQALRMKIVFRNDLVL